MDMSKGMTRRRFLATGAAGVTLTLGGTSCSNPTQSQAAPSVAGKASPDARGRVVILGFDGVEPSIAEQMMDAGQLPNLAKLKSQGTFKRLGSTIPPQSPVAWTTFATCKNPGGHNIFDFIRRSNRPTPLVGTGSMKNASFNAQGELKAGPSCDTYRKGRTFWSVADEQGAKCKVMYVPFAFPADPMTNGFMLGGLGVPDLRGTTSTFVSLADNFTQEQLTSRPSGGIRIKLEFDANGQAQAMIPGPRDERKKFDDPSSHVLANATFSVDRNAKVGAVEVNGKKTELIPGQWSPWVEWEFPITSSLTAAGISRFYPLEIGQSVRLYMTCVQFHPQKPFVPFTSPDGYSAKIADRYGLYKTIGWGFDTHALRQDAMDEEAFMQDIRQTMAWKEKLTHDEFDQGDWDMLISVWEETDRVGHMFWRFRDPKHPLYDAELAQRWSTALEDSYRLMDGVVGNVMGRLKETDLLLVLSDHGFESWRTGFNVNTWLKEQGFLDVTSPEQGAAGYLQGVDWAKTKAYSVGLSSMYLNLAGRESKGVVARGEANNLIAQLKDKLLQVVDPNTGSKVFSNIYTRDNFSGEAMAEAPDISFGYDRFYQSSKGCASGGVTEAMFEPNDDKWSGEHASSDLAWCPGIFFSNKPVEADNPNIIDFGKTALAYLGRDAASDFEGTALV